MFIGRCHFYLFEDRESRGGGGGHVHILIGATARPHDRESRGNWRGGGGAAAAHTRLSTVFTRMAVDPRIPSKRQGTNMRARTHISGCRFFDRGAASAVRSVRGIIRRAACISKAICNPNQPPDREADGGLWAPLRLLQQYTALLIGFISSNNDGFTRNWNGWVGGLVWYCLVGEKGVRM